jgi:hypothetical protein
MQVIEVPSSSNPICDHSDIIEENNRLKAELAKGLATCIQGEKNLNDLLNNQRMIKGKEGLGFVAKSSKKGISDWWPSPQRRRRRTRRRRSLLLLPPFLMFHLTFVTQRRSGRLKGKEKKVEETGVSRSKGPKSPAGSSSPVSPAPKAGVSGPQGRSLRPYT